MKKLAILGGTSWHSSIDYYRLINQAIQQQLGGAHSADLILRSVNFQEHQHYQHNDQWDKILSAFIDDTRQMEQMGAEGVAIAANTMHLVADELQAAITIPVLHIADAIASIAARQNFHTLGILGTEFTMARPFYRQALIDRKLESLVPPKVEQAEINRVIYQELTSGQLKDTSRDYYLKSISQLNQAGADAVILGCTEIGLLVKSEMTDVPLIDSLQAHVDYLVDWCLGQ